MSEQKLRAQFETWISSPPYERNTDRFPNDPKHYSWPGQYRDINVQLAFEAWKECSDLYDNKQID